MVQLVRLIKKIFYYLIHIYQRGSKTGPALLHRTNKGKMEACVSMIY